MEKNGVIKIALVGPESTGKTTLAIELAEHYHTVYVKEFAREYFNTNNINEYTSADLDVIYAKQLALEETEIQNANQIIFCDSALLTGVIWSKLKFGCITSFLKNKLTRVPYDFYLLCNNDVTWVKDDQRKDEANRVEIFDLHKTELNKLNANYCEVVGVEDTRKQNAIKLIDAFLKTVT